MWNQQGGYPYRNPLTQEDQMKMLESQLEALKSMGSKTTQYSLLDEIGTLSSNLSEDEKKSIEKSPEYTDIKNQYEAGFLGFLGNKFSSEYITTSQGKIAGERLLDILKDVKGKVKAELEAKAEKLQKVADLLDAHPELLKNLK